MSPSAIVQKLWDYCNVHRDDGMSYLPAGRRVAMTLEMGISFIEAS